MIQNKKHLLLLSYEYPFGYGETFLECEIPILSREFCTITIIPSRAYFSPNWFKKNRSRLRPIPENCTTLLPNIRQKRLISITDFIFIFFKADFLRIPLTGLFYGVKELMREAVKAVSLMQTLRTYFLHHGLSNVIAYTYWKGASTVALCALKKKGLIQKCVTRCHGGDLYYDLLPYPYRPFERFLASYCDLVMPVSQTGLEYLASRDFSKNQLRVSRLGVKNFSNLSHASTDNTLRIVSCSNLILVKRVSLICEALTMLRYPFHWFHFGDGEERSRIEDLINKIPIYGTATIFGRVSNDEVLSFYRENPVDVFVNVSISEGVPVSIMEAMMAGIPCVVTDVGGTSEIISKACGHLLSADIDATELASIFNLIGKDPKNWHKKRSVAYSNACGICDAEINYYEFAQILVGKL